VVSRSPARRSSRRRPGRRAPRPAPGNADDPAGRDQAHRAALQLRAPPLSAGHHALGGDPREDSRSRRRASRGVSWGSACVGGRPGELGRSPDSEAVTREGYRANTAWVRAWTRTFSSSSISAAPHAFSLQSTRIMWNSGGSGQPQQSAAAMCGPALAERTERLAAVDRRRCSRLTSRRSPVRAGKRSQAQRIHARGTRRLASGRYSHSTHANSDAGPDRR
jgi:hypothetical protein